MPEIWLAPSDNLSQLAPNRFQVNGGVTTSFLIRRDWVDTKVSVYLVMRNRNKSTPFAPDFVNERLIDFDKGVEEIEIGVDELSVFGTPIANPETLSISLLKGAGNYTIRPKLQKLDLIYLNQNMETTKTTQADSKTATQTKRGRPGKSSSSSASIPDNNKVVDRLVAQVASMQSVMEELAMRLAPTPESESYSKKRETVRHVPESSSTMPQTLVATGTKTDSKTIKIPAKPKCGVSYQLVAVELEPELVWRCPEPKPVPMPSGGSGTPTPPWSVTSWIIAKLEPTWLNANSTTTRKYVQTQYRLVSDRLELRGALTGGSLPPGNTNRTTVAFKLPAGTLAPNYDGHTLIGNANGHTNNENDEVIRLIGESQPDGSIQFYFEGNGVNVKEIITFDVSLSLSGSPMPATFSDNAI